MKKTRKWTALCCGAALVLSLLTGCVPDPGALRTYDHEERDEPAKREPVYETRTKYLCVDRKTTNHDTGTVFHEYYTYDEYGNMVESWTVTENGERINYTTYRYDENGNLLESSNPGQSSKVMTYDSEGRILTERYYFGEECKAETEYTYDEAGYLIRKDEVERYSDEQVGVTVYTYNEDHSYVRIDALWGGTLSNYTEQILRENGDVKESVTYAADGSWLNSASCEYDAQGRLISQWNRFARDEQADFQTIFTYDERGLLISRNADYYYGNSLEYTYEPFEILVRVD